MSSDKKSAALRHDMRNQLTVILAMAQLLERKVTDKTQREQARTIGEKVGQLNRMIDEIKD